MAAIRHTFTITKTVTPSGTTYRIAPARDYLAYRQVLYGTEECVIVTEYFVHTQTAKDLDNTIAAHFGLSSTVCEWTIVEPQP
jgi:hypothetical protein